MASKESMGDDLIGATIAGRYRVISRLGAGGMGTAYRAWDEQDGVPVVIKIPKKVFLEDPKFAERFHREIRLLQGLTHPHIVPIVDVGTHEGLPFVAMRFLPGGSLSNRRLRDEKGKVRPNPPGMLHLWLPAVAEALDYVHSQGVVHRDVKPANIFFDAFWGAYLGDFGIAKVVEESETFDKEHTLTATHMGIGTQEYMCPEQFTPKAVIDGRADQYALAVMVYEMLAGTRPFTGATAHLIVEVTTHQVPSLEAHRRDLPVSLVEAVHRGLAKRPEERFATCRDLAYSVLRNVSPIEDEPGVARLLCPKCSNILKLPTEAAGRKGACPKCQTKMKVAEDLGALWLLDEARRQGKAASRAGVSGEQVAEDSAGVVLADEEGVEAFTPVSSTTPIEKATRPQARKVTPVAIWGGLAAALIAAVVIWNLMPGAKAKKKGLTYEEKLAKAEATLQSDPSDRAANEFLGRHWCFKERNWDKGLPFLSASGHDDFAGPAKDEVAAREDGSVDPGQFIRVARRWWDVARDKEAVVSSAIETHAIDIYRRHVGLLKTLSDIAFANKWLDEESGFRRLAGNTRPARPIPTFPPGAMPFNGHTYFCPPDKVNQNDARILAEKLGGSLVVIDSGAENKFVAQHVRGTTWLGIGKSKDGWISVAKGAKATYFAWDVKGGQPSNGRGEVAASTNADGVWHDHFASDELFYAVEWPEDMGVLSAEHARKLVAEFKGASVEIKIKGFPAQTQSGVLPLSGLQVLDAETAKALSAWDKGGLTLNGLTSLSPDVAKELSEFLGSLHLDGLTTLTPETAKALINKEPALARGGLSLDGLARITPEAVEELREYNGALLLNGLTTLTPELAERFAESQSDQLALNGLTALTPEVAKGLTGYSRGLALNGLSTLAPQVASGFCGFKGRLYLNGLTMLTPEVASGLAGIEGGVHLGGLTKLTPAVAKVLAASHCCLSLGGLTTLTPEVANELAKHKGGIYLDGLTAIMPAVAKVLAASEGSLSLDGLTTLTPELVEALTGHKGGLSLDGVATITHGIAKSLAGVEQGVSLDGLTMLSPEMAKELGTGTGYLSLDSLTTLTPEVAKGLAGRKGILSLNGVTMLTTEAASELKDFKGDTLRLWHVTELPEAAKTMLRTNSRISLPDPQ